MSVRVIFKKSPIFTAKKIAPVTVFQFILVWALARATKSILDLVHPSFMHLQLGYLIVHCKKFIFIVFWLCSGKANFLECKSFFFNTCYTKTLRKSLLKVFQIKIPLYNFLTGVVFNIQCIKLVIINLSKAINQVRNLRIWKFYTVKNANYKIWTKWM
jgi:hypothetical protein